jgi:hypothetical protein
MPQPQRRAGCSAIAAAADGVLQLAVRATQRSPRGKAVEHIMLANFAAGRVRLPLYCGRHAPPHAATPRVARLARSIVLTSSTAAVTGPRHFFLCEAEAFTIGIFRPTSSGTALGTHRKNARAGLSCAADAAEAPRGRRRASPRTQLFRGSRSLPSQCLLSVEFSPAPSTLSQPAVPFDSGQF